MSCFNKNCQLCRNLVISTAVAVVTVDGTDTLVVTVPEGVYANCSKVCLVIAQTIPDAATINMPVAITIAGGTGTYPIVDCTGTPVTATAIRTRRKYCLKVNAVSNLFQSTERLMPCDNTVAFLSADA